MLFEGKHERVIPFHLFLRRWMQFAFYSVLLIGLSVGIGVIGYHRLASLNWIDSFYMASMILTGMGPTVPMVSDDAKIFSSFYALYSGVAFLSISAVFFAPVIHRFLHRIHADEGG